MASTNKTTHYDLSQYVSSDKPTYLVDYNGDMAKIDTGINAAKTTADSASTAATNAQTAAENAATTANTAVTNAAAADTKATTANTNIGTMANLSTTEKQTLVGAINEVNTKASTSQVIDSLSGSETTKAPSVRAVKESFEEVVLFENENGTLATNITLSESIANFERIEIITGNPTYKETIEIRPKHLGAGTPNVPIYYIYHNGQTDTGIMTSWWTISGTLMKYEYSIRWIQAGNSTPTIDNTATASIYGVYGYRK
jgi:hypothetical protein